MDQDEFDQTQAIALGDDDYNDDTDDLAPDEDKKPVGFLKVLLQKGLTESVHPLYEGDNIIGRNPDTCHVHIASKSLSKEHACIQIVADVHMIFDKNSRNKTRRGKLCLSPDVRYELKNNEELMFADVKCVYQIADKVDTVAESDAETDGSESMMLKYDVTNESIQKEKQDGGNDSKDDDSILPATQCYREENSGSKVMVNDTPESAKARPKEPKEKVPPPTLVLFESESDEEEERSPAGNKNSDSVLRETLLCEESVDESSRDKPEYGAATQAYCHDDRADSEDDSSRQSLIGAATQAYGLTRDEEKGDDDDDDDDDDGEKKLMEEPTQAFKEIGDSEEGTEQAGEIAATQSFKVAPDATVKGKAVAFTALNSSDSSAAATQVFEEEDDEDDEAANILLAASTLACDDDLVEDEDDTDNEEKEGETNSAAGAEDATQVFPPDTLPLKSNLKKDENGNSETVDVSKALKGKKVRPGKDPDTVPVLSDDATVPIPSESSKRTSKRSQKLTLVDASDLPTQFIVIKEDREEVPCDAEAETQVFSDSDVQKTPTSKAPRGRTGKKFDPPTLVIEDDDEAKDDYEDNGDTQVFPSSDTVPLKLLPDKTSTTKPQLSKRRDKKKLNQPRSTSPTSRSNAQRPERAMASRVSRRLQDNKEADEPATIIIPEDDIQVISHDEPTQAFANADHASVAEEDKTAENPDTVMLDEPTQAFAKEDHVTVEEDDKTGENPDTVMLDEPTQAFGDSSSNMPTQVFAPDDDLVSKTAKSAVKKSHVRKERQSHAAISSDEDENDDVSEKPWKSSKFDEPTQAYSGDVEENEDDGDDGKCAAAEEATQAYGFINKDDDDDCEKSKKTPVGLDEPTQAYDLDVGDVNDGDATQPFDDNSELTNNDDVENDEEADQDKERTLAEDPTQKYDMAVDATLKPSKPEENRDAAAEESEDDSDLEDESVLRMEAVADTVDREQQLLAAVCGKGEDLSESSEERRVEPTVQYTMNVAEDGDVEPPLSPQIPDKSSETPVVAGASESLSDTEEMVPDSMPNSDPVSESDSASTSIIPLPLPSVSPLKPALVDRRRSPSPSRKHVAFVEPEAEEKKSKGRGRSGRVSKAQTASNTTEEKPTGSPAKRGRAKTEEAVSISTENSSVKTQVESKVEDLGSGSTAPQKNSTEKGDAPKHVREENAKQAVQKNAKTEIKKSGEEKEETNEVRENRSHVRGRHKRMAGATASITKAEPVQQHKDIDKPSVHKEGETGEGKLEEKSQLEAATLVSENQTETTRGRQLARSKPAAKTKGGKQDTSNTSQTEPPTSPARVSSRGRRITRNTNLKDFETGKKSKRNSLMDSSHTSGKLSDSPSPSPDPVTSKQVVEVERQGKEKPSAKETQEAAETETVTVKSKDNRKQDSKKEVTSENGESRTNESKVTSVVDSTNNIKRRGRKSAVVATKTVEHNEQKDQVAALKKRGSPPAVYEESHAGASGTRHKTKNQKVNEEREDTSRNTRNALKEDGEEKVEAANVTSKDSAKVSSDAKEEGTPTPAETNVRIGRKRGRKSVAGPSEPEGEKLEVLSGRKAKVAKKSEEKITSVGPSKSRAAEDTQEEVCKVVEESGSDIPARRSRRGVPAGTEAQPAVLPERAKSPALPTTTAGSARGRRGRKSALSTHTKESFKETPAANCEDSQQKAGDDGSDSLPVEVKRSSRNTGRGAKANSTGRKLDDSDPVTETGSCEAKVTEGKPSNKTRQTSGRVSKPSAASADTSTEESVDTTTSEMGESTQNSTSARASKRQAAPGPSKGEPSAKESRGANKNTAKTEDKVSDSQVSAKSQSRTPTTDAGKGANKASQPTSSPKKVGKHRKSSPPPSTPKRKSALLDEVVSNSPSLRTSTLNHRPKVMFTGVIDEQGEKILTDLGGELAASIHDCTHLVTDKIRRTVKFLAGLAKGALIVTPQWLESSKRAGTFLDGHKFLVSDTAMEKQYRFSLQSSIDKASDTQLLEGYSLHVTPSVKPDPLQMKDILTCAGAKYLPKMPGKAEPQLLVISCPEDKSLWSDASSKGIPVVGPEFILTGILRQELQPQAYYLEPASTGQSETSKRGRGRKK